MLIEERIHFSEDFDIDFRILFPAHFYIEERIHFSEDFDHIHFFILK